MEANRAVMAAKEIDLVVDLPKDHCLVDVDPTRFVQILSNLLHNAAKFTDRGGSVRISAVTKPPAMEAAGQLSISVVDSGIGMAPELLPRVFDLFTQAASSAQPGAWASASRWHGGWWSSTGAAWTPAARNGPRKQLVLQLPLAATQSVAAPERQATRLVADLLLASQNPGKLAEMRKLVTGLPFHVVGPRDLGIEEAPEETGKTFHENAVLKARYYAGRSGLLTVADDSGLCVDALDGGPGLYSSRFGGEGATDDDRNRLLLEKLRGLPPDKRGAHFTSAVAVVRGGEVLFDAQETVDGLIAEETRAPTASATTRSSSIRRSAGRSARRRPRTRTASATAARLSRASGASWNHFRRRRYLHRGASPRGQGDHAHGPARSDPDRGRHLRRRGRPPGADAAGPGAPRGRVGQTVSVTGTGRVSLTPDRARSPSACRRSRRASPPPPRRTARA